MKKIYACFVVLIFMVIFLGVTADAKTQKKTLINLEETMNLAVSINYEKEEPIIYFISPDGRKYSEKNTSNGKMQIERGKQFITFYIPNAKAGKWVIVYDKKKNQELEVNCSPYVDSLSIDSLSAKKAGNDYLKVKFKCSHEGGGQYEYEILAVTKESGQITGTKLLGDGVADVNKKQEIEVPLDILSSYKSYYVQLQVRMDSNGLETWDEKVTDKTFSYVNKKAPEKITDCIFTVDISGEKLLIDWSSSEVSAEEYILAVYTDKKGAPMYSQTVDGSSEDRTASFQIDLNWKCVYAHIAYKQGGLTSQIYEIEIPLKENAYQVSFQTEEYTNSRQLEISYYVPQNTELVITINENEQTETVKGKNIISCNLPGDLNDCRLVYQVSDNLQYLLERSITVDSVAPIFNLYEDYSDLRTTNRNFLIVGVTEKDAKLYINNQKYKVESSGSFQAEVDLALGENIFEIKAEDAAGNASKKTVVITRFVKSGLLKGFQFKSFLQWIPMLCAFLFSFLVGLFLILQYQHARKKSPEMRKRNVRLFHCSFTVIILICALAGEVFLGYKVNYYFHLVNGRGYYDLVKDSVEQAYLAKEYLFKYTAATGAAFLIIIFLALLLKRHMRFLRMNYDGVAHIENVSKRKGKSKMQRRGQFCKYCGKELTVGSRFCAACGKKQE